MRSTCPFCEKPLEQPVEEKHIKLNDENQSPSAASSEETSIHISIYQKYKLEFPENIIEYDYHHEDLVNITQGANY